MITAKSIHGGIIMAKACYKPTVCVIGGDRRNIIISELFAHAGYDTVYVDDTECLKSALNRQIIILPLPISRNGTTLNCKNRIELVDIIDNLHPHSKVFYGGINEDFCNEALKIGVKVYDYYNNERVLNENAYLTAEGTLKIIIENTESAIIDEKFLIVGNGRCGKALAKLLQKLSCDVTVATRKQRLDIASALNYTKLKNTSLLSNYINDFDIIINTAPTLVLDKNCLSNVKNDALIIELASNAAGIDMSEANLHNLNVLYAPGLPGKYSPASAAKVLYQSITKIISEEFA